MLLRITTTHRPATDLGYLLHKNPEQVQTFSLGFGQAHVFFPEAGEERCTAALLLDVDPVGLVRRGRNRGFALAQYVNDRPYVASSFLSVALSQVYGSAMAGKSRERPELAATTIPLEAKTAVLPCRGGKDFLYRLFEPLGYTVAAESHMLDKIFQDWGESPYFTVTLSAVCRLSDLLSHLYVLAPVLDDEKHYYVSDDEVGKLLRHGDRSRAEMVDQYVKAYRHYCWPVQSIGDLKLAPFHLLATEGAVHTDKDHLWHMETLARVCRADPHLLLATPYQVVDLMDEASQAEAIDWWTELTTHGGEGIVVKPLNFVARGRHGPLQPGVKCRGREYLRIIYGPEYTSPENMSRLRKRSLSVKRSLALREFALGLEALERFVRREPLRRVHECVFGVLAFESEPVDPRL